MKLRHALASTKSDIAVAIGHLKAARTALHEADCPRALAKVSAAIKSADGARRHAEHQLLGRPFGTKCAPWRDLVDSITSAMLDH